MRVCFLCDAMLGSLCRWLRFFGYDAAYGGVRRSDGELLDWAGREGRWLVTRDRELASIGPRTLLVRSIGLEDQLVEVLTRLRLDPDPDLDASRCADCNGALVDVDREALGDVVPPFTLKTASRFRRCGSCGRVYWPGTHGERIVARLRRVAGRVRNPTDGSDEARL